MSGLTKIFYEEIIKEAREGQVNCYFTYNILFNTIIPELNINYKVDEKYDYLMVPILQIHNLELFDSLLEKYLLLARSFYNLNNVLDDDRTVYDEYKVILTLLWSNASVLDFDNPIAFLEKRIAFFENSIDINTSSYNEFLGGELETGVIKNKIQNETPYAFVMSVKNEDDLSYEFPVIHFGISDGVAYVYAIQSDSSNDNSFCKKVNRKLYKLNDGVPDESLYKDVTHSFVFSFNAFLKLLLDNGIKQVEGIPILYPRYNAKQIAINKRADYCLAKNKEFDLKEEIEKAYRIQLNVTNKFINLFYRINFHYQSSSTLSKYINPYDVLKLTYDELISDNEYLNIVFDNSINKKN